MPLLVLLRRANHEIMIESRGHWESQAKLDAFGDKLRPRIQAAGIQLSGEPEVFEAHIVETF